MNELTLMIIERCGTATYCSAAAWAFLNENPGAITCIIAVIGLIVEVFFKWRRHSREGKKIKSQNGGSDELPLG